MNNIRLILTIVILSVLVFIFIGKRNMSQRSTDSDSNRNSVSLVDGDYEGFSQSKYTSEPFWGHVKFTVKSGAVKSIYFTIRDTVRHETVDSLYGTKFYPGNKAYMQQCVNDGNGIKDYPQRFLILQDLDGVDAISGATWSYNIFRATVKKAFQEPEDH